MEQQDQLRLLQEAAAIEQAMAAVRGEALGAPHESQVQEGALTVLAAIEGQYPGLRQWIDQAGSFAAAQAASTIARTNEHVTDVLKGKFASRADEEKWALERFPEPNADDPPSVLRAYAAIARIAAGGGITST